MSHCCDSRARRQKQVGSKAHRLDSRDNWLRLTELLCFRNKGGELKRKTRDLNLLPVLLHTWVWAPSPQQHAHTACTTQTQNTKEGVGESQLCIVILLQCFMVCRNGQHPNTSSQSPELYHAFPAPIACTFSIHGQNSSFLSELAWVRSHITEIRK